MELQQLSFDANIISMTLYIDSLEACIPYALLENNTISCGERSLELTVKAIKIDLNSNGTFLLVLTEHGELQMIDTET